MATMTSRSRLIEYQRCQRSRYWLHEAFGTGYELVKQAVPLATGKIGHLVFAEMLREKDAQDAIRTGLELYDAECGRRGLQVAELEDQNKVYAEQRALVEGLGWLAALEVIPRLLETYEVLEVEQMDVVKLGAGEPDIYWRSIADGLLRNREDGELYVLSLKTPAEPSRDGQARVDMQGISETWAIEQRPQEPKIRGVQMLYLYKGRKIPAKDDPGSEVALGKSWRHNNPLIWGYRDQGFPPSFAAQREWRCTTPHSMRKSKWYPTGECPGDGRAHRRGDDWQSFAVWETMDLHDWIVRLQRDEPAALGACWAMPVPNFRQAYEIERWKRQMVAQERKIAQDLDYVREFEAVEKDNGGQEAFEARMTALDITFPMATEKWCDDTYGRRCPAWDLCHGPESTTRYPLASGLYQVREQYEAPEALGDQVE